MQPAFAARCFVCDPRLGNTALDGIIDELFMALFSCPATIDLRNGFAIAVVGIGIDAREGADRAGRGPGAGRQAIGHANAFAAFNQGQDFPA